MTLRVVEGAITSLGSISGTDGTPVSLDESTRALRIFIDNPSVLEQTTINSTAAGPGVQILGKGPVAIITEGQIITVSGIGDHAARTLIAERLVNGEDLSFFYTDSGRTVQQLIPTIAGATASGTTWTVRHDSNRQAIGTEIITGGINTHSGVGGNSSSVLTTFDNPVIPGSSFVWLETTSASGIIDEFSLTLI